MLTRRRLLAAGFITLSALAARGLVDAPPVRAADDAGAAALDPSARAIVAAIAPVMLAGALPPGDRFHAALHNVVEGTGIAIAGLPPSTQREIGQLFSLLSFPLARYFVAGVHRSWDRAQPSEIEPFLQAWRTSPIATLRIAYDALHQLIGAAWYGNPESWPPIGYPGPPALAGR